MIAAEQIAQLLLDNPDLGLVAGETLFVHRMPAEVARGVVVLTPLAGGEIDWTLPGWRCFGRVQTIVRDPESVAGLARARAVADALTFTAPTWRELPAAGGAGKVYLKLIRPIHDPIVFPRSQGGDQVEISTNYELAYALAE